MNKDFLEWLEKQPRSKTQIRDVLTGKKYEYKPAKELYELFISDQNDCKHPQNQRTFIGSNILRCGVCGEEFS